MRTASASGCTRSDRCIGPIELLNVGLERTRGGWIHVLGPGEPQQLEAHVALRRAVAAGLDDADIATIGAPRTECWALDLATPAAAFVARRELYESAGGFCATAGTAFAWELLQRLAASTLATPLVVPAPGLAPMETVIGYGEDVITWLAAIDLATASGLPEERAAVLRDRCASRAAGIARAEVEAGRFDSAYATLAEALRTTISSSARGELMRVMAETLR